MSVRTLVKSIQDIMRQDVGVDGDAQRISQLCWMFFLKIIDDQDQELELMQEGYRSPVPEKFQWRNWAANPEGLTGDALMAFINSEMFPALKELPATAKSGRRRVVREVFEDAYNYMKSGQLMRQVINKITAVDFNNLAERQHFGDIYEQILNDLQSAGNAGEYYTPRAVTAFMANRIDPRPGEILLAWISCSPIRPSAGARRMGSSRTSRSTSARGRLPTCSLLKEIRFEPLQGCIDGGGGKTRKGREETPQAWKVTAEEVKERGYNLDIKNPHAVADDHGDPDALLASLNAAEADTVEFRDQLKAILAEALAR